MLKLSAINLIRVFLLILVSANIYAQGVITTPRVPSPAGMVAQTIGISTVTVKYSRPSVKNREIWGALVPYGYNVQAFGGGNQAPWRAGANENTVIELSHPATIEGQRIPAGSYGLFFVINKDNTGEVILSKDYKSWGSFWYDPKQDEMRADKIGDEFNTHYIIKGTGDEYQRIHEIKSMNDALIVPLPFASPRSKLIGIAMSVEPFTLLSVTLMV